GVAGAVHQRLLPAAAGVHGLPAVPRAALALRAVGAAAVLPGQPLLAGPVLSRGPGDGVPDEPEAPAKGNGKLSLRWRFGLVSDIPNRTPCERRRRGPGRTELSAPGQLFGPTRSR